MRIAPVLPALSEESGDSTPDSSAYAPLLSLVRDSGVYKVRLLASSSADAAARRDNLAAFQTPGSRTRAKTGAYT
ncbi:hypothetical protein GCM10007394_25160 [Salinibacterium amurskyense]|nr:hypothetical protein GCM10007394_25160 [Salinibacterium amurskyense]